MRGASVAEHTSVPHVYMPVQNEATAAELQPKEDQLEQIQATVHAQVGCAGYYLVQPFLAGRFVSLLYITHCHM